MPALLPPRQTTAKELFKFMGDGYRYELISGNLAMMSPAGGRHGRIAFRLAQLLGAHVESNALGVVFAAKTGFLIGKDPDTVLAPDVAFVSRSRFNALESEIAYPELAPDLVAEVLSPSDRFSRVESKAFTWLDAGTKLVLIVDPENLTALVKAMRDLNPYYRGAPPGLPFTFDVRTLDAGLNFTLTSDWGDIDLLGEVAGNGSYETLIKHIDKIELFGHEIAVVTPPKLIALKRAAGRPKDFESIAELEALEQERN